MWRRENLERNKLVEEARAGMETCGGMKGEEGRRCNSGGEEMAT